MIIIIKSHTIDHFPSCSLAPKYEELGTLYSSIPKVVIAKVDATANDVPEEIQGFPTIKLFPAGRKSSPVDYSGARTVDDLAKFIEENGTHKAAMPKGGAGGSAGGSSEQMVMDVDDDTTMAHQAPAAARPLERRRRVSRRVW